MNDELTRCNKPEHWDEPNPCTLCLLTQEDVSNILRLLREKLSIEFWPGLTNLQLHITALRAQLAQAQEAIKAAAWDDKARANKRIEELEAKLAAMEKERDDAVNMYNDQCEANRKQYAEFMKENTRCTALQQQLASVTAERDEAEEILEWFESLVKRAQIGTKQTPSLRAYIEQLEHQLQTASEQQERLREALEHCVKVFRSMSDRGAYPAELLPFKQQSTEENSYFLGKQGWRFAIDALAQATPSGNAFDARKAVVELAEMVMEEVERVDEYGYTLINGEAKYQRAVELKRKAKG